MTGHTELPWTYDGSGKIISTYRVVAFIRGHEGDVEAKANAHLIVKAVNMHDRLLVALQGLDEASELIRHAWDQEDAYRIFEQAQQNARALLTEAGEQP